MAQPPSPQAESEPTARPSGRRTGLVAARLAAAGSLVLLAGEASCGDEQLASGSLKFFVPEVEA